jgi:hypothetical protein
MLAGTACKAMALVGAMAILSGQTTLPFEGRWILPGGNCAEGYVVSEKEWRTKGIKALKEPDEVCAVKAVKTIAGGFQLTKACKDASGDGPANFTVVDKLTDIGADKMTWKPGKGTTTQLARCK